jgi:hypothetical protein
MTTLTAAWMLGCVVGFFLGVTVASGRRPTCRELSHGGNIGATPLVCNEGRTSPPPAPERWATVTVQGLNWPATLGDFTLVGPVNNHGAWRWYERQHNGATHRIKVDHQLQCLHQPVRPERPG